MYHIGKDPVLRDFIEFMRSFKPMKSIKFMKSIKSMKSITAMKFIRLVVKFCVYLHLPFRNFIILSGALVNSI